jgi:two-component system, OmpR family, sensor kinase
VTVDLNELCAHAAADARAVAPDRRIAFHPPGVVTATGDPDALRQVLANLTRNALIHTPDGTPVEIGLRCTDGRAVIEVRDHGPGLAQDVGERVFDRFWRDGAGRTRGRGGAGLGLAIVREIVEAHHGTVTAANHPEGGAVFTVTLPGAFSADSQAIPGIGSGRTRILSG